MQPLPSMEMLAFLDWMDKRRIFNNLQNETIEEYLFNHNYDNELLWYAHQFLENRKGSGYTNRDRFKRELDYILEYLKAGSFQSYEQAQFCGHMDSIKTVYDCAIRIKDDEKLKDELRELNNHFYNYTEYELIHSIRQYLNDSNFDWNTDYTIGFLRKVSGTSTNAMAEFIDWLKHHSDISEEIANIPDTVLNKFINNFEIDYYGKNYRCSREQAHNVANIIKRTFQNARNIQYFDKLTRRYSYRIAAYKCLFLSEDNSFYELVEKNWSELNGYSGDHLDIFYRLEELKSFRGYYVADELSIRNRVSKIPCIYLWQASLSEGKDIPVAGLDEKSLLELIKGIVDLIVENRTMDEIVDAGRKLVELLRLRLTKNEDIERNILKSLERACQMLQNNPVTFGNVDENQKNTQIRDLLRSHYTNTIKIAGGSHRIEIEDQTLNGLSSTGKSYGELDLLVKVDSLPFCIVEGIDYKDNRFFWNHSKLYEHINRLGNYDQNGLERNIILVYVTTNRFEFFYHSMIAAIKNNQQACIRESKIEFVKDYLAGHNNASMRIAKWKYTYNDRERYLYTYVVQISQILNKVQK